MGKAGLGRPATPTPLKMVKGERKDRINTSEPVPKGEVESPEWLNGVGLDIWHGYAPDLVHKKVLTAWDVEEFAAWCEWCAAYRWAVADIHRRGELIETPILTSQGELVGYKVERNPACITRREASDQMLRYGARFGLTPSDRTAIKVDSGPKTNNKARLLTS